jgi:hypothetical protein
MVEPWLKTSVSSADDVVVMRGTWMLLQPAMLEPAMLEVLVVVLAQRALPLERSPPAPVMSPSDWLRPEKFMVILSKALL